MMLNIPTQEHIMSSLVQIFFLNIWCFLSIDIVYIFCIYSYLLLFMLLYYK